MQEHERKHRHRNSNETSHALVLSPLLISVFPHSSRLRFPKRYHLTFLLTGFWVSSFFGPFLGVNGTSGFSLCIIYHIFLLTGLIWLFTDICWCRYLWTHWFCLWTALIGFSICCTFTGWWFLTRLGAFCRIFSHNRLSGPADGVLAAGVRSLSPLRVRLTIGESSSTSRASAFTTASPPSVFLFTDTGIVSVVSINSIQQYFNSNQIYTCAETRVFCFCASLGAEENHWEALDIAL